MLKAGFMAFMGAMVMMTGCQVHHGQPVSGEEVNRSKEKIIADAYLFDARLRFEGKPRSFRLEVFDADSIIGLYGKGYLGKRAIVGRLTADSLEVYFPPNDEYLYEATRKLLNTGDCITDLPAINLMHLFRTLPTDVFSDEQFTVEIYEDGNRRVFTIFSAGCSWKLSITYQQEKKQWRIFKFMIDNGHDISLSAKRRVYREKAKVPLSRFQVLCPITAVRIIP